jgi:uncharacterized protein (DUF2132 family)
MTSKQPNNPLHGVTLKTMLEELVLKHGWNGLYEKIQIRCFENNPSVKSSLKFLRKTEWARNKLEKLYIKDQKRKVLNKKRAAMRKHRTNEEDSQHKSNSSTDED